MVATAYLAFHAALVISMNDEVQPTRFGTLKSIQIGGGDYLSYRSIRGPAPGGVIFLPGFRSEMTGTKASRLASFCSDAGRSFVRFDYRGHGESSGDFEALSVKDWFEDSMTVLDELTDGPQVLVGSSMGAWIAALMAVRRPDRVVGILGIGSAPDFTDRLYASLDDSQKQELSNDGVTYVESEYSEEPYPISKRLIENSKELCLLHGKEDELPVDCRVRLIHGEADVDVPWRYSLDLAKRLRSRDVQVVRVKDGDHRLSRETDLARMIDVLSEMLV